MRAENRIIQGLWVGAELSEMERLSISSFMRHGHEYHLYVYEEVRGVPAGVTVKDGAEILPASMIFQYRDFESYAGFSNFFRYKLLLERGGWWADTDVVCLRPFDFAERYVFASEMSDGAEVATSGVIKAAQGSEALAHAWRTCQQKQVRELKWGETGPKLVDQTIRLFALEEYRQPAQVFSPLNYWEWERVLEPERVWKFAEQTRALHLWNEMWRRAGRDKNQSYDLRCLYEKLKREFLPQ